MGTEGQSGALRLLMFCLLALTCAPGCAIFLPAHSHSNQREGEKVTLELLDEAGIRPYAAAYAKVFGTQPGQVAVKPRAAGAGAALAGAAIGLAVDYVQRELQREATLYEAQFEASVADDRFWQEDYHTRSTKRTLTVTEVTKESKQTADEDAPFELDPPIVRTTEKEEVTVFESTLRQRYYGFRVVRQANVGGEARNAFEMVFGMSPSADQRMLRIAPLRFQTSYAKAKVLSDERRWWPAFWTWVGRLVRVSGHAVDTEVAVEMDAYWVGKDQLSRVTKVAAFSVKVTGYDINGSPILEPGSGLGITTGGWIIGVPVSYDAGGKPVGQGTFTLRTLVTECDPTNAREYLEEAAKLVGEQKERIVEAVTN